jgi:flagellar assembly factor FliW
MGDFLDNLVYSRNDIITFPEGIPGFVNNREYVLVQLPEYLPFEWLACTDKSHPRFAIINPVLFKPDYAPRIIKEQLEGLGIKKKEDILIYVIITIMENPEETTANLIGPLVINRVKRIGKQIIIDDDRYTTKERILGKI